MARTANYFQRPPLRLCRMNAQPVEAVIFDMDGVLTNTMAVSIKCASYFGVGDET